MTYRVLEVSEWYLVQKEFDDRNIPMPDPRFAMVIAAFEGTEDDSTPVMAGFIVLQMQFHAEPLVVYNPLATRGLISTMEEELSKRVGKTHYYVFAEGRVAELARAMGIERVDMDIFKKAVE
jgi:hypothetical protein